MSKIKILTTTIPENYGGRTKSILQRCKELNKKGIEIDIVTTNRYENYSHLIKKIRNKKIVLDETNFINIYDFLRKDNLIKAKKWQNSIFKTNFNFKTKKRIKNNAIYFYKDNKIVMKKEFYSLNKIKKITIWDYKNKERYTYFFDIDNNLKKIHTFVFNEQYTKYISFPSLKNKEFIKITKYDKNDPKKEKFILNQDDKNYEFKNENDFLIKIYEKIFNNQDKVIVDARKLDYSILNFKDKDIKRIFVIHNHHILNGKKRYVSLDKYINKEDELVILTKEQSKKIIKDYDNIIENQINIIGHPIEKNKIKKSNNKGRNNICIVSRFDEKQKNILDAIKTFDIFNNKHKKFNLLIYGFGKDEYIYRNYIKENKIKNVIIKGRTKKPDKVFNNSKCFLLTSNYEGFGMTVLESIANGCPVASYNYEFGANEIIKNFKNGIISKENTPESLSKALEDIIFNKEIEKKIKDDKYNFINKDYFVENYTKKWIDLIKK